MPPQQQREDGASAKRRPNRVGAEMRIQLVFQIRTRM